MIKRAPRPDNGFLILRNDVARDARMSYRASGLLAAILSRPDNWETSAERLAAERPGGEGIKAVRAALRELEQHGYLRREKCRDDLNRFFWVQTVFDIPQPSRSAAMDDVSAGQAVSPFPPGGNPPGGNRPSKEEPTRSTEKEDVLVEACTTSSRFAPSGGGDEDPMTDEAEPRGDADVVEFADWRTEDRASFLAVMGERIQGDGSGDYWKRGTFDAELYYNAFRKRPRKPLRWPGRFVSELYARGGDQAVDDWLMDQGLERVA